MTLSGHTNYIGGVAFSSDHSYLASCSNDGFLNVWNYSTSWSMSNHLNNGPCYALAQLPNSQLAAAGSSYSINIWSPLNNSPSPVRTLTGHTNFILGLALSPDKTILASGSQDNTIKLWSYTNQTTALKTLTGHTNQVRPVCFVSNQILASGSFDKTIKIWNIQTGKSKYIYIFFFFLSLNFKKSISVWFIYVSVTCAIIHECFSSLFQHKY